MGREGQQGGSGAGDARMGLPHFCTCDHNCPPTVAHTSTHVATIPLHARPCMGPAHRVPHLHNLADAPRDLRQASLLDLRTSARAHASEYDHKACEPAGAGAAATEGATPWP
eukprot:354182-Chlamydomonas_euryale.AAC.8